MNEIEFQSKWESDKHVYRAWGKYIVDKICHNLKSKVDNLDEFLKVPVKFRLKDDKSIIDKAFYRPEKKYSDPYNEIEDKVGARFIVLLLDDIKIIYEIVQENNAWSCTTCKHFEEDRKNDPLLFTYQSVHCILRSKEEIAYEGVKIPADTPCEVQIRTLLQHAHAELTHDAIYKSRRTVQPEVHRTVAKSMALIETTDDFFLDATRLLNYGPLEEHAILYRLDGIYLTKTGIKPHLQKSSIIIWDVFEQFINDNLVDDIKNSIDERINFIEIIKKRYSENVLCQQSTILFVIWMLIKHKRRLLRD